MKRPIHRPGREPALRLLYGSLVAAAVAAVTACGASSISAAVSSGSSQPAGTSAPAGITVSAKAVPGVGTVLVNGKGQTLYMLTTEKDGKITCTVGNGCTKVWPDTELPGGVTSATAGSGIQASLLGTAKNAAGELSVTYNGWPLYTYAGDNAPGQANGEAISGFGGQWYVLGTSGNPVTSKNSPGSGNGSGTGGGGY